MKNHFSTLPLAISLIFYFGSQTACDKQDDLKPPIYVAHAGGVVQGEIYTNSLEALNYAYKNKIRFFEIDINKTADGFYVLMHHWREHLKDFFNLKRRPTLEKFKELKIKGKLTTMTLEDLVEWIDHHRDAYFILDFKDMDHKMGLEYVHENYFSHQDNFIPQIYEIEQYKSAKKMGFKRIILTTYETSMSDKEIIKFSKKYKPFAVTMPIHRAMSPTLAPELWVNNIFVYAHPVNDQATKEKLIKKGVKGFYTHYLHLQ